MMIITPSTWPYGSYVPKSLLNGNRCVYLYDVLTRQNLQKAGVPVSIVTLKDWAVFHKSHTGPTGQIMYPTPAHVNDNLPAGWTG